jgi:hypothetical protein
MIQLHLSDSGIGANAGSGHAVSGATGLLGLAAAPVFGLMALWSGMFGNQPDFLCMAMHSSSPFGGMATMYGLMSAFHLAPWLRLLGSGAQAAANSDR